MNVRNVDQDMWERFVQSAKARNVSAGLLMSTLLGVWNDIEAADPLLWDRLNAAAAAHDMEFSRLFLMVMTAWLQIENENPGRWLELMHAVQVAADQRGISRGRLVHEIIEAWLLFHNQEQARLAQSILSAAHRLGTKPAELVAQAWREFESHLSHGAGASSG